MYAGSGCGTRSRCAPRDTPRQCKLVAFVPDADLQKVSDALFAAGAGMIGQYNECSFRLAGTGTFFGTEETNPTVGQKGRREEASEWRLEVVVPEHLVSAAVAAMRAAHSYEEPAFDVYPLKPGTSGGEGRFGELDKPDDSGRLGEAREDLAERLRGADRRRPGRPGANGGGRLRRRPGAS